MKLSIVSLKGMVFEGEVEYVVVEGNQGQLAILKNHVPIVVPITNGFVKKVNDKDEYYYVISGGFLEHNNNVITVIAQEVGSGKTLQEAKDNFANYRKEQKEKNRKNNMDFTEMEKELALNIKEIQASKL